MELYRIFQALKTRIESALLSLDFSEEEATSTSVSVFQFEIALKEGQAAGLIHSHALLGLLANRESTIQLPSVYQNAYLSGGIFLEKCKRNFLHEKPDSTYALSFSSLIIGNSPLPAGTYCLSMALNIFPESRQDADMLCFFEELTTLELYPSSGGRT